MTEFCERLAFYGFAGSLVLFFEVSCHLLLALRSLMKVLLTFCSGMTTYYNTDSAQLHQCWSRCAVLCLAGSVLCDPIIGWLHLWYILGQILYYSDLYIYLSGGSYHGAVGIHSRSCRWTTLLCSYLHRSIRWVVWKNYRLLIRKKNIVAMHTHVLPCSLPWLVYCGPPNIIPRSLTGTGGIKPNVSTLGADQFDERYSVDRKEKESFFNWWVLFFVRFVLQ